MLFGSLALAGEPVALVPSPTVPGLAIPAGAEAAVFADHERHQVASPAALCIDEQGRVLVAEALRLKFGVEDNRNHRYWLLDDIASTTTDDRRAMHEKWNDKVSIASLSRKSERIRMLVDTNKDGTADQSIVFAEGFNDLLDGTAGGIFSFQGTVYFACIPHIWALQDTDGDNVADFRASMHEGFGVRVSLSGHDLNGFVLGPDGRLYGTIGDRGMHLTTDEGRIHSYTNQGAVFRFDPDGSNFEVIHAGLRNPKELAFDKWGNAFTVDNNSDQGDQARLVYIMTGADSGWRVGHQNLHTFHRSIGYAKRPINQWMRERQWDAGNRDLPAFILPPVANITTGPAGLTYQPGTGFKGNCEDSFLVCDYRGAAASSGIWAFGVEADRAGMKILNPRKWAWGFAATDVEFGYDGRVYATDFIGGWASHDAGRVLTISSLQSRDDQIAKLMTADFDTLEVGKLRDLAAHADQRVRFRAALALSKRPEALELFTGLVREPTTQQERIHGTWGLWMLARRERSEDATKVLLSLLGDEDAEVRAQAARALGEAPLHDAGPLAMALRDPSNRVKAFAALSLARLRSTSSFNDIVTMLAENDNDDLYLRHAGIMGLLACGSPEMLVAFADSPVPSLRLAAVVALRRHGHPGIVRFLFDEKTAIADEVIRAVHDVPIEGARPAVAGLLDDYAPGQSGRPLSRMLLRRIMHSAFRVGSPDNASRLLRLAANPDIDLDDRLEALRLLTLWTNPPTVDQALGRHMPLPPRQPADIVPALNQDLAPLLDLAGPVLAGAIDLIGRYGVVVDSVDDEFLTRIVTDRGFGANARTRALEMLDQRKSDQAPALLDQLVDDPDDQVAKRAVALIIANRPEQAATTLGRILKSPHASRRQDAWKLIQSIPGPETAKLVISGLRELSATETPLPYALEILEAAEARAEPAILDALSAYRATLPADDPLAAWRVALRGGDPVRGDALFHTEPSAQCLRCHRAETTGDDDGLAGPQLSGVGRNNPPIHFLESLVTPNAKIAPGFGTITLTFQNGGTLTGIAQHETETHLDVLVGEKLWRIRTSDIADRTTPVSAMPSVRDTLSRADVRDLVAYLSTLKQEPAKTVTDVAPESFDPSTIAPEPAPSIEIDPAVAKLGRQSYSLCMACHGPTGRGNPGIGPPLAGSEWVLGPPENLIRIQLRGLTGPIRVAGREYNFAAAMPAQAFQTDAQIAAVLTYIRNSWGNQASPVTPEMVAALRSEVGKPPLTVSELIPPPGIDDLPRLAPTSSSPSHHEDSSIPWIPILLVLFWVAVCAIPIARSFTKSQ